MASMRLSAHCSCVFQPIQNNMRLEAISEPETLIPQPECTAVFEEVQPPAVQLVG